ncbi:carbamoyltransferase C-terminal domain-containing protein [Salinibacter ruber]|uniref:carbamoyltransferase C-terminal domain-containing protein n=1 Tax=Salinibacter ruber TaxID=146919 RepID=UPI002167738D|nr:carbamoyltransferase C-terminal domain-containing protein [Salinibacter ruber]MCS4199762.1 hypothetical protein [Salinibacter ruber]
MALGNRSILADPGRADARDRINNRVKYREEFRPFAPSILEEAVDEYFTGHAGSLRRIEREAVPLRIRSCNRCTRCGKRSATKFRP